MDISDAWKSDNILYAAYGPVPGVGLVTYNLDLENRLRELVPDSFNRYCTPQDVLNSPKSTVFADCARVYKELKMRTDALGLDLTVDMSEADDRLHFVARDGNSPADREPAFLLTDWLWIR